MMAWSSDIEPRSRSAQMFCAAVFTSWLALSKSCCIDGSTTSKESPTISWNCCLELALAGRVKDAPCSLSTWVVSSVMQIDLTCAHKCGGKYHSLLL